jgi:hypothetical protein
LRDWGFGEEAIQRFTTGATCATDRKFKLVRRGLDERLYDLHADPLEVNPLQPGPELTTEQQKTAGELRRVLDEADVRAVTPPGGHTDGSAGKGNEELEARLRLLGYL